MSSFEGEIYEVMVASKSLNDFAIRNSKDISLTNGVEFPIWHLLTHLRQIDPCLVDRKQS